MPYHNYHPQPYPLFVAFTKSDAPVIFSGLVIGWTSYYGDDHTDQGDYTQAARRSVRPLVQELGDYADATSEPAELDEGFAPLSFGLNHFDAVAAAGAARTADVIDGAGGDPLALLAFRVKVDAEDSEQRRLLARNPRGFASDVVPALAAMRDDLLAEARRRAAHITAVPAGTPQVVHDYARGRTDPGQVLNFDDDGLPEELGAALVLAARGADALAVIANCFDAPRYVWLRLPAVAR